MKEYLPFFAALVGVGLCFAQEEQVGEGVPQSGSHTAPVHAVAVSSEATSGSELSASEQPAPAGVNFFL